MTMNDLIEKKVSHKKYGEGEITRVKENAIWIKFPEDEEDKYFPFPADPKILTILVPELQKEAEQAWQEKRSAAAEEKREAEERIDKMLKSIESGQKQKATKKKSSSRNTTGADSRRENKKNLAFKLNYCDGGETSDTFGFKGICSKKIRDYNIGKAKRTWCSSDKCLCRQLYEGSITEKEFKERYKKEFVCYECITLSGWIGHAGANLKKNTPRRFSEAQRDRLAILTTRTPGSEEKDCLVIGVFIIDSVFEGDDEHEGTVSAKDKYKIELRRSEALKFWDYHENTNNPDRPAWNSGLYRYVTDEDALRLLEDIVKVKRGKPDEQLAVEILDRFKDLVDNRLHP